MQGNLPPDIEMALTIAASGLFDDTFYLKENPDVAAAMIDPILHYVRFGEKENRNPSQDFQIDIYRQLYGEDSNILYMHILKLKELDYGR